MHKQYMSVLIILREPKRICTGSAVKEAGGIGKFFHHRVSADIDNQTVVRMNRDTLYSSAVFDLDAGPVTFKLPDSGGRFRSRLNQQRPQAKGI